MNYKSSEVEASFEQKSNKTFLFFPVRDCYSDSIENEEAYEELFTDFINDYNIILDYEHNISNIYRAINKLKKIVFHSQFQLIPIFSASEFVNAFSNIIRVQSSEYQIICLEIIANLWRWVEDDSTGLTDHELVKSVIKFCDETNQSEILPYAYFAIANYCAISNETREYAKSLKIINKLEYYMRRETIPIHVKSGLRLSLNILLNGVEDIWMDIIPLISKFRFHVQSSDQKNRSLAAKCLMLIVQNTQCIDACLSQIVHISVYNSIIQLSYSPHVFDLALLFVQAGIYQEYITIDFINYCNSLLDNFELDITSFFNLINELMPFIKQMLYDQGTISKIIQTALEGSFENMKSATLCLIKFMNSVDLQVKFEIASSGAFEACCNLIGTSIDSYVYLLSILETIYDLLAYDITTFLKIAKDKDLDEILQNSEIEDEDCCLCAQKILEFISEPTDDI